MTRDLAAIYGCSMILRGLAYKRAADVLAGGCVKHENAGQTRIETIMFID